MNVGTGASSVKSEPNVVPMIDVMLVLLIIFMVIAPAPSTANASSSRASSRRTRSRKESSIRFSKKSAENADPTGSRYSRT